MLYQLKDEYDNETFFDHKPTLAEVVKALHATPPSVDVDDFIDDQGATLESVTVLSTPKKKTSKKRKASNDNEY